MKIIVPTFGTAPDQNTTAYIIDIAKRLDAQLVVLRILAENETEIEGNECLSRFIEMGQEQKVLVNGVLRQGDITSGIIEVAEKYAVALIILGVKRGEIIVEWLNANAMKKTDIPVLIIPKWVPTEES